MGKTAAEMRTVATFLEAGWCLLDETTHGTADIWWIDEGKNYRRLTGEPGAHRGDVAFRRTTKKALPLATGPCFWPDEGHKK
ncbi:MAG: hypothetical protein GX448_12270 [Planctomycetes bacterium]|nr:hypothetical protein [Planctomycetota bacterium]